MTWKNERKGWGLITGPTSSAPAQPVPCAPDAPLSGGFQRAVSFRIVFFGQQALKVWMGHTIKSQPRCSLGFKTEQKQIERQSVLSGVSRERWRALESESQLSARAASGVWTPGPKVDRKGNRGEGSGRLRGVRYGRCLANGFFYV